MVAEFSDNYFVDFVEPYFMEHEHTYEDGINWYAALENVPNLSATFSNNLNIS